MCTFSQPGVDRASQIIFRRPLGENGIRGGEERDLKFNSTHLLGLVTPVCFTVGRSCLPSEVQ